MPKSKRLIKFSQPGTHTAVTSIQSKANAARAQTPSSPQLLSQSWCTPGSRTWRLPCLRSRQWAFCADSPVLWVCSCATWGGPCCPVAVRMRGAVVSLGDWHSLPTPLLGETWVPSSLGLLRLLLCEHDNGHLSVSTHSTASVPCVSKRQPCAQV